MNTFKTLGLPDLLVNSLEKMKFEHPTPIQEQAIPLALSGADVLGTAQTGTGKTAAYAIPLVAHLMNNPGSSALILTPTRELALQVFGVVQQLIDRQSKIYPALLIGGEPITGQFKQLKNNPRLIVGTPGRVNDHLLRVTLKLNKTDFIVIDETDRMLDMGFVVQLKEIARFLPEKRQTLMFSATMAPELIKISKTFLTDEERVSVGSLSKPIEKIKQETIHLKEDEKYETLKDQLEKISSSGIVFVRTQHGADKLAVKLQKEGVRAEAIHGGLRQRKRERVIKDFRNFKTHILVATDVAARGLDISHVECVINYNLPQCPEDYIHRIGRTGRSGAEGRAVNFVSSGETGLWKAILKLVNPEQAQQFIEKPIKKSTGSKKSKNTFNKGGEKRFDKNREKFQDRIRFVDKKTERSSDKPRFSEKRKDSFQDKPKFFDKKTERSSDKPRFSEKRKDSFQDKPKFFDKKTERSSDKPRFSEKRKDSFQDKPKFFDKKTERSSDKPRFSEKRKGKEFAKTDKPSSKKTFSKSKPFEKGGDKPLRAKPRSSTQKPGGKKPYRRVDRGI